MWLWLFYVFCLPVSFARWMSSLFLFAAANYRFVCCVRRGFFLCESPVSKEVLLLIFACSDP